MGWPRPDPGNVKWSDHWTVETLDQHPAATPYRPSWKRPPPSGPTVLPGNHASAPRKQESDQPKTANVSPLAEVSLPKAAHDDPPVGSGEKGTDTRWGLPSLLFVVVAGVLVLGLGLLFLKRGLAPRTVGRGASVKVRCARCGKVVKVLSGTAGKKFQCPGCGVIQTMGGVSS